MAQPTVRAVLIAFSTDLSDRVLEVGAYLERFGFAVETATDAHEVLAFCGRARFDAVLFDLVLTQGIGTATWLEKLQLISPMTASLAAGPVEQLEHLRKASLAADGDYVLFPLSPAEIRSRLRRLIETRAVHATEPDLELDPRDDRSLDDLIGKSHAMQTIRDRIRKIAVLNSTVLVTGESGVGKELIARGVHKASPRRDRPFVALNCSALPEQLLESELFGHERGAFTGASGLSKGKFELAHNGTLFLDEIGDMSPVTQAKILRVIEEKEFMRVGGSRNLRVDVRLVAATNANLKQLMAEGRFREDLYYRLKVLTIEAPSLRQRLEDIPEVSRALLERFARSNGLRSKRLTPDALAALSAYRWPGNIRELRNTLESLFAMAPGDVIDVEDMDPSLLQEHGIVRSVPGAAVSPVLAPSATQPPAAEPVPLPAAESLAAGSMEEMEKRLIEQTLTEVDGNRTQAARLLKIGVRTLQRKIKRYGLDASSEA